MSDKALLAVLAALFALLSVAAHAAAADEEDGVSPHARMVRDQAVCLDCHTRVPAAGEHAPDHLLSVHPSEVCLGCHSEFEHAGTKEHLGQDARPLLGDEKGKIACFTCHDPHPEGVIAGRRVHKFEAAETTRALAAARLLPRGTTRREPGERFGALLRYPSRGAEGCRACHATPPDRATSGGRLLPGPPDRLLLY